MSDEVKAAAERRRAYLAACQNQTILTEANPYIGSGWRIEMDCITLADAFLATRDARPIEPGTYKLGDGFTLEAYANDVEITISNNPNSYGGCEHSLYLPHITTRGQLLALLAALGIEKEKT